MLPSIKDELFKSELIIAINSGANYSTTKSNFYEHIRTKYKIGKQRSLQLFDRYYFDYQKTINNAQTEEGISNKKEVLKSGLKTKFDRLMILQNQIDKCLENLTTMKCDDVFFVDGIPNDYKRNMNQREMNDTRKTLNTLQIEISKIEGDYASTKTETELKINKEVTITIGE